MHPPPPSTTPTPYILLSFTLLSLLLLLTLTLTTHPTPPPTLPHHPSLFPTHPHHPPTPPSLAYFITGSAKDSGRITRLLYSIYHPKNQYLIHLDRSANQTDRDDLAVKVQSLPLFRSAQNVHVIGKADFVHYNGPSSLSSTLRGASVLLRVAGSWDWFVNLKADDYPLVTQDDLLHILSYLPRDLNFVNHTSYIGWRESRKLKPIVVDTSLFLTENNEMFYATQKRPLPDAYRLFTGSSTAILSRKFIEFCILGTDNLPRTLLMYLSNTQASSSVYFPTVLCNSRKFNRTTINHSLLHYASLDSSNRPLFLNSSNFDELIDSGAAFASPFSPNDEVLDRIDQELLQRNAGEPVPGGWCLGETSEDKCAVWGDANVLRPGPGAKRLEGLFVEVLSSETSQSRRCVDE